MDGGQVAEIVGGAALVTLGLVVLRYNAATAEHIAEWNKFKYDRRATLYDLDRAERLRKVYEAGPLDRLGAIALAVVILLIGATVIVNGVG